MSETDVGVALGKIELLCEIVHRIDANSEQRAQKLSQVADDVSANIHQIRALQCSFEAHTSNMSGMVEVVTRVDKELSEFSNATHQRLTELEQERKEREERAAKRLRTLHRVVWGGVAAAGSALIGAFTTNTLDKLK